MTEDKPLHLSLEQTMFIGVMEAFGIPTDTIALAADVLNDSQIMDFLWWMEHRMQELKRYLRTEEVLSELSVRTFQAIPDKSPTTTNDWE